MFNIFNILLVSEVDLFVLEIIDSFFLELFVLENDYRVLILMLGFCILFFIFDIRF